MISLSGKVTFDNWDVSDEVKIKIKENNITLYNNFIYVELDKEDNYNSLNYFYDDQNQIIVFSYGKIILNSKNQLEVIRDRYLIHGENYLIKIPGFFCLVLIDIKKKKVLLSSDILGLLKLYYSFSNFQLNFSTSIKDIIPSNFKLNKNGLLEYLLINYYITDNTLFQNIHRLLPSQTITFTDRNKKETNYFNLLEDLITIGTDNISIKDVVSASETLKEVASDYSDASESIITLTSGLDSRLLFSALLANKAIIDGFTFGVQNNIEFEIAERISEIIDIRNYEKILLNNDYSKFITTYFEYIVSTKNIDLNINRYHYVYVWEKINNSKLKGNILTGIGGNTFVRDGLSISKQTNQLLYGLIYTQNKEATIEEFVQRKISLLNQFNISKSDAIDYLSLIFKELKENDNFFNHYYIKINYGIRNYFGSELSIENQIHPTYTPFFDIRYLEALAKSGYSIFSNTFLNKNKQYKVTSHRFYAEMVSLLYSKLLDIPTNRGYPLRYSLNNKNILQTLTLYYLNKRKNHIVDLDYKNWLKGVKTSSPKFEDSNDEIKYECVKKIFD